ncbi:uncharacterized protein ACMZJ9_001368 [Mantella aurantiaca]
MDASWWVGLVGLVGLVLTPCVASVPICDLSHSSPVSDSGVRCMKTEPAVLGGNVTLTCFLSHPGEVIQVTWCASKGEESKLVASHSKHGRKVTQEFSPYVSVLPLDGDKPINRSSIEISKLEEEDEACYICHFNIKHNDRVTGAICLTDIGPSNEVTCSAPGKHLGVLMNPPEIKTRKSEQDVKGSGDGNVLLKGRYSDSNLNPTCTFSLTQAKKRAIREEKLREGPDEKVVFQCSASGKETPQIHWNDTDNEVGENKMTTHGNVTTITSSRQLLLSSLKPDHGISCKFSPGIQGNLEKMAEENAVPEWIWPVLAVVLVAAVVAAAAIYYFRKCRNSNNTSNDERQMKTADENPVTDTVVIEYKDETPTKDSGAKNHVLTSDVKRKLEFE